MLCTGRCSWAARAVCRPPQLPRAATAVATRLAGLLQLLHHSKEARAQQHTASNDPGAHLCCQKIVFCSRHLTVGLDVQAVRLPVDADADVRSQLRSLAQQDITIRAGRLQPVAEVLLADLPDYTSTACLSPRGDFLTMDDELTGICLTRAVQPGCQQLSGEVLSQGVPQPAPEWSQPPDLLPPAGEFESLQLAGDVSVWVCVRGCMCGACVCVCVCGWLAGWHRPLQLCLTTSLPTRAGS